jgi:hypothetical protein
MASLAISIMNRNGRVLRCINSWLAWEGCEEVVIIDWSSEFLINDFLKKQGFYDKKIKIVRVDGEQYFSRSRSFNLSVKHCTCEEVVRIDVDYVLTDEGLLNEVYRKVKSSKSFAHASRSKHLTGFCIFKKADFLKIGGYNEEFEDWGYEDYDLYNRLEQSGLNPVHINNAKEFLFHIPHSAKLSVENHKCKNRKKSLLANAKKTGFVPEWIKKM